MTTHYVDLTVIPDPETSSPQLMGALYDKLHRALAQRRIDSIGASFPRYSTTPRSLGNILRLHGTETSLHTFLTDDWLRGMRDHVRIASITATPDNAAYRTIQRKQFKTSVERLRRRRMRRKQETEDQVTQAIPASIERVPHLPYIHLHSLSTGQPFALFIAMGPLHAESTPGIFNTYGLSNSTTIPWF